MSTSPEPPEDGEERNDENVQDEHVLRGGHPSYGLQEHDQEETEDGSSGAAEGDSSETE